jgi:uncharacterized membrane protein
MSPFILDWLNLLARWAHLVAGIAWIGTSFYFIALDFELRKREGLPKGVLGEAWQVHGGGFYQVQKYLSAPEQLPEHLVWFKWEAYLTWVSGFLLLVLQYYINADTYLIDTNRFPLATWQAIAISLGSIAAGWLIYDQVCRSPVGKNTPLLGAVVFAMIMIAAYAFTHIFTGRGALIHVGAFMGTIMAANVFMVIIPNQRKITASLIRGEAPDPRFGATGKQRSLHNTYLTLPTLLLMISNHYAFLTDHPQAWILIGLITIGGACLRHYLLRTEVGDEQAKIAWALPVIASALGLALAMTQPAAPVQFAGTVSDNDAMLIIANRCAPCHATKPLDAAFKSPPKGVVLETIHDMKKFATQIERQAVLSRAMPLGNKTGITDEERAKLATWLAKQ